MENPGDSSASVLLHHLTPGIQLLPWPAPEERDRQTAGIQDTRGVGGGGSGQDEGGEPGNFPPRAALRNRRLGDEKSEVTCGYGGKWALVSRRAEI